MDQRRCWQPGAAKSVATAPSWLTCAQFSTHRKPVNRLKPVQRCPRPHLQLRQDVSLHRQVRRIRLHLPQRRQRALRLAAHLSPHIQLVLQAGGEWGRLRAAGHRAGGGEWPRGMIMKLHRKQLLQRSRACSHLQHHGPMHATAHELRREGPLPLRDRSWQGSVPPAEPAMRASVPHVRTQPCTHTWRNKKSTTLASS